MRIGVPKEIKPQEYRVSLVPDSVYELVSQGHQVVVESTAGEGIGYLNHDYEAAGATICTSAADVFAQAELIVKVKEPLAEEINQLQPHHILFTYLHLAASHSLTSALASTGCMAIAYETVTSTAGALPLLTPMSEVAGRMATQAGAHCLQCAQGGRGILLAGVPGTAPAKIIIIGGGVVGRNAATIALGMGADVTIIDKSLTVLRQLDGQFQGRVRTRYATKHAITQAVLTADCVIGSVLIPGGAAPKLVTEAMVAAMQPGSVVVDVAIDQGGTFETSRATTHAQPTYQLHGVVHYCVANMPGAVAKTASHALNHATLPYIQAIAEKQAPIALLEDTHFMNGLNLYQGVVTHQAVAQTHGMHYVPAKQLLT